MHKLASLLLVLIVSALIGYQVKQAEPAGSQGNNIGIQVHGNWTVEVRNPDGSLATRKQFTNSFEGQQLVAGLLSLDVEVTRLMSFAMRDSPSGGGFSDEAECEEKAETSAGVFPFLVPAKAIHASNDNGKMYNSVWNASCTLVIAANEPKFITRVTTKMDTTPKIYAGEAIGPSSVLSRKMLAEPIPVWDGQVVAATVTLAVD